MADGGRLRLPGDGSGAVAGYCRAMSASSTCPNCGDAVQPTAELCPNCGFDLRSEAADDVREHHEQGLSEPRALNPEDADFFDPDARGLEEFDKAEEARRSSYPRPDDDPAHIP